MTLWFPRRAAALALILALPTLAPAPAFGQSMPERAETLEPPPPVPVAQVRRTPPPPIATVSEQRAAPEQPPAAVFRVRVTGAGQDIWSGEMSLEGYQGSEMRMTLQQADNRCGPGGEMRASRRQTGLRITLNNAGRREPDAYAVAAEWTRQSPDCAQPGTRTSGIETTAVVAPGATRVIEADGGLRIELTRRR